MAHSARRDFIKPAAMPAGVEGMKAKLAREPIDDSGMVQQSMDIAFNALSDLKDVAEHLAKRLDSVLRPNEPDGSGQYTTCTGLGMVAECPLACRVRDLGNGVYEQTGRLRDILNRLQVS